MTPPLYTIAEIVAATGGRAEGVAAEAVGSISIDSREIGAGALFAAIRGDRFDGHDFAAAAVKNGATAAMVSEARAGELAGLPLIVVPDALKGLRDLARAARTRSDARIVAVTGSAGKTTTKEAIRTVLEQAGETHASIKSFNNHWGVPLMLARMPRSARYGVFELGMNHAGEITPLSQLVRPHVAVVTTVAAAHLEFFASVADIARAKAEIFAGLEPGGTAVLNRDHAHFDLLVESASEQGVAHIVSYGFAAQAEWRIEGIDVEAGQSVVRVAHRGGSLELRLAVEGRHMAANAVAALAVADVLGIPLAAAEAGLAQFAAPEGRGVAIHLGSGPHQLLLVDESYNANAASMRAALEVFAGRTAPAGRKVLVLGDMLELGATSAQLHAELAEPVIAAGADAIFLVGTGMAALADALGQHRLTGHAASVEDIAGSVLNSLAHGDLVMIKGSNGVRLGSLVTRIRDRFQ